MEKNRIVSLFHDDFVNGSTLKSNSKLNKRNEEDNHSLASG
jgi:hypothetical protein